MKKLQLITLAIALVAILVSCKNKNGQSVDRSVGGTSEVLFVTQNDEQWNGQMGQAVRDFFEQEQYGLPQPEKTFRVAHINIDALNDMFKKHRNLIIAEIVPELPNPIIESQYVWKAKPQYAIRIKAKDAETWVKIFDDQKDELKKIFDKNERARFMDFFRPMANAKVMETLKNVYGFTMTVPEGYYVATNKDYCTWLRKEEVDKSFGLIVYQLPYKSTDDLNEENLIATCSHRYNPNHSEATP